MAQKIPSQVVRTPLGSQFDFLTKDFNDDERIVNRATLRGSFENFDR